MESLTEDWKKIKGHPGYMVSTFGRVALLVPGKPAKFLKQTKTPKGYMRVSLPNSYTVKHYFTHRLVALAFIPYRKTTETVNHKDKDRANNFLYNLEFMTRQENLIHARDFHKKEFIVPQYEFIYTDPVVTTSTQDFIVERPSAGTTTAQTPKQKGRKDEWRDIPYLPGYQASHRGAIRDIRGAEPRLLAIGTDGTALNDLVVVIYDGKKSRKHYVCRLVADAFWKVPSDAKIGFRNGDRSQCNYMNLRVYD